jgi:hypothetical protein
MHVKGHPISSGHESRPVRKILEAVVNNDERAFAFANPGNAAYHVVSLDVAINVLVRRWKFKSPTDSQSTELCVANVKDSGLVHDTKHGHNVPVFRLGNKFGDNSNVIQGALGVGHAHDPPEKVDLTSLPRVIET